MTKKKIVIYGSGNNLLFAYEDLKNFYSIVAITDGNPALIGECFFDTKICALADALAVEYDLVVVTPANTHGIESFLAEKGVSHEVIITLQEALDRVSECEWENAHKNSDIYYEKTTSESPIALVFFGGIGDFIIGSNWLSNIVKKYNLGDDQADIYVVRELIQDAHYIFKNIAFISKILSIDKSDGCFFKGNTYNTILRFCILPETYYYSDSSPVYNEEFRSYIERLYEFGKNNYNRGLFTTNGYSRTIRELMVRPKKVLYHTAYDVFNEFEKSENKEIFKSNSIYENDYLQKSGLKGIRYITINTGLNKEYLNKNNTRAWGFDNWVGLALSIKEQYPDITVVQVGHRMRKEDDIPADIHLNGKTSIEEIGIVLKNSLLHIDYDSGLVHIRHLFGKRSIVLMGPSSKENHAYPENIYVNSGECEACEWSSSDWLSRCGIGDDVPRCMCKITVEMVMDEMKLFMKNHIKIGDRL